MARFTSDTTGNVDDRVRITLGDREAFVVESYTVRQSFLTQPATFSLRIGHAGVVKDLLRAFPPNTSYMLSIGDVLQQTGAVDDPEANGDASGGSSVVLTGRDAMAPLVDGCIEADRSFTNATYADLVQEVLNEVYPTPPTLQFTNTRNRRILVGGNVIESDLPIDPVGVRTGAAKDRPMQAKAGEQQYRFLRDQLDRAGLFLFCAANGDFILTAPNAAQVPIARITDANILSYSYKNGSTGRYARYMIHGRGGGGKDGRQNTQAEYVDQEMVDWGFTKALVVRDAKVANAAQADAIARRRCAERRRNAWFLKYKLRGHTMPSATGRERVVLAVDTVVEVDHKELGIQGTFWVESVDFSRPPTETSITLMRPEDLVFGGESE